jgi:hypothetical protein
MVKTLFFLFIIPFLQITAGSYKSTTPDVYYNIIQQDTFYFLLSNNNIKLLSNGNSPKFILWDSIQGQFSSSTLIAINNNYLLLKNNDSISLYKKDLAGGKLTFKNKSKDNSKLTLFFAFNNDFVAVSGSMMNILGCNDDSIYIKTANFAAYNGQSIYYPYFVKLSSIYKYVEGFGYYEAFNFTENVSTSIAYKGSLIYHICYYEDPNYPPIELYLKKRWLKEPDFLTYYSSSNNWGQNLINTAALVGVSDKYLIFGSSLYTYAPFSYEPLFILNTASYQDKIFITDKYIFKLGSDVMYTTSVSPPPNFTPFIYSSLTDVNENYPMNTVFSLEQNYPNPFNSETKIGFTIKEKGLVKIKIYDIMGNIVRNIISEEKEKGSYTLHFQSAGLSSGIYFYSLITDHLVLTKKMIILK